jgi:hypothetical protein
MTFGEVAWEAAQKMHVDPLTLITPATAIDLLLWGILRAELKPEPDMHPSTESIEIRSTDPYHTIIEALETKDSISQHNRTLRALARKLIGKEL